jgi:RimJ/RimL family protein N-acetyltransferase
MTEGSAPGAGGPLGGGTVSLRDVIEPDLDVFFHNQLDPEAIRMAAFTAQNPADRVAFRAHWANLLADDTVVIRTVVVDGRVAGNVLMFPHAGQPEVGYWLGRPFWGRGIATRALDQFLRLVEVRPLFARVAKDNAGSLRVLQKCEFTVIGEDCGFAHGRGADVEEYVLRLD